MIRKIILALCSALIVQLFMPSAGFTLQWPSPSSRITAGYGYRIHPVYGMSRINRLWHNGIDISTNRTNARLKAVTSGAITFIKSGGDSGNRVRFGDWEYLHLSDPNPPNWEFGDATGWNEEDKLYNLPVKYFAIQDGNTKIYYSTNPKILFEKTGEKKDARTSITESDFIVYSGSTGVGTAIHLHLINYNGGDPTKSPLISLYDARRDDPHGYIPPLNENSPVVSNLSYDGATGIVSGNVDTGRESDINRFVFVISGGDKGKHEISFSPRINAKDEDISGGEKTGIRPLDDSTSSHNVYYDRNKDRKSRYCWGYGFNDFMASLIGEDVNSKIGSQTINVGLMPPPYNCPGYDFPDDNNSVSDDSLDLPPDEEYTGDPIWIIPRIGILKDGFVADVGSLLQQKKMRYTFNPVEISSSDRKDTDLIIIPSGGLHAVWNSDFFKAGLESFVRDGGLVMVFAQQHGHELSALPVPQESDGTYKRVSGYGWIEDQSCQYNSSYIDTWHQILAAQSRSTPSLNVDGYFTTYPSNTTVILRRTANGQPSLIMYPYGNGYVIATTMYSDFAYGTGQATKEEISLIRDMITWAKAPAQLPEVRPGEVVSVSVETVNTTDGDASSVKLSIYNPDRTTLLLEQTLNITILAGQSSTIPVTYTTDQTSPLGIYHIDYTLYDSSGTIIQPQTETDSGRFVVSNPPANPYKSPDFGFSVQSDAEYYIFGSPATFTFTLWNFTDRERQIQVYGNLSHHRVNIYRTVTIAPKSSTQFTYVLKGVVDLDRCFTWFYDENNKLIARESKGIWVVIPSVDVTVTTDKKYYAKGETVEINVSLKNNIALTCQANVSVTIIDYNWHQSTILFNESQTITLFPLVNGFVSTNFTIPADLPMKRYMVVASVGSLLLHWGPNGYTWFDLPQSQISVTPNLPSAYSVGTNSISFTATNTGRINVSSGLFDLTLTDPDKDVVYSTSQPFSLTIGESKTLDFSINIPSIEFGYYTLTYSQSDETGTGNPTTITIPNNAILALSFDKPSYRIRETANLAVNVTNMGKFDLENVSVTVSAQDVNYTETKTILLGVNPNATALNFTIPIPETLTAGQHNVDVTVALSSGSVFAKTTIINVSESKLVIDYPGTTTLAAGDTITLTIENTGGVDTTYTTEKLSINDRHGVEIYHGSIMGAILSGEKKTLVDIQIPSQAMNGPSYLHVQMKDSKTGKTVNFDKPIEITGLTASLQARTDKDAYLKTESITGISSLLNGGLGIEAGSLKVSVNKISRSLTGQFTQYLPKQEGISFSYPGGVAVGPDSSVYVADTSNHRIQKFDSNGNFMAKWGNYCTTDTNGDGVPEQPCDGQFLEPWGIAVGPDGSIYIADSGNNRIQKFDSNGNFITKWGSEGNVDGQFEYPISISVASDGSVYMADTGNHRIQKFDSNGNFIAKWGNYCTTDTNGDGVPDQSCNDGQFNYPEAIAVGPDSSVYVADDNHRIQKFDNNGNFITKWGSFCNTDPNGDGVPDQPCDGQFYYPYGIAIGLDGSVYISDSGNNRIQRLDSNGNFITKWGNYCTTDSNGDGIADQPCDGQFDWPGAIAIGTNNMVYIADTNNHRIEKFDINGNFIGKWGSKSIGGPGSGDGEFIQPEGVAIGSDGSIYIADSGNNRIQMFNSSGDFITKWGSLGSQDGQFDSPKSIAVGPDGSIYVVDAGNHRVQKFDSNGNLITKWGSYGIGDGQFYTPYGIAVGPDGMVYVSDAGNARIQKFDSTGNFISKWIDIQPGWQFIYPTGIAVGPDSSVYVSDSWNFYIHKFDSNGNFITNWEIYGRCEGECSPLFGVAVGPDGSVYVTNLTENATSTDDYPIQKFDGNGNLIAKWGSYGSEDGQFQYPEGISVAPDGSIYAADTQNHRIQRIATKDIIETLFETTLPINQPASTTQDYITTIGTLNTTGKLNLLANLKNSLDQTIDQASYPFYIFEGNTILLFNTDKKIYKPGETATITGQVENHASIEAANLVFSLNSKLSTQNPELLFSESFSIPAGGIHPFTVTAVAGAEGTITLTGEVRQNNSTLAEIADQYEVAKPSVSVSVSGPDIVGNEPFNINMEIKNTGKVDATAQFGVQSPDFGDLQSITIPAGEIKLLQYSQQITKDTSYTFTFAGDYQGTFTKIVSYGLGASIAINPQAISPEGNVAVPVTISNTGQLSETIQVNFQLSPVSLQNSKTYYLPSGASTTDILYFDLSEGDYQLTANSQLPTATAQASFSVRKENQVEMAVSVGAQTDVLIPVNVNLTNLGFNEISGSVNVSVSPSTGSGQVVWNAEEPLTQLLPQNSQLITLNINPSAIEPGDYNLEVKLLNNSNQVIAVRSLEFVVRSSSFQITQLPPYQTFTGGQEATFTFRVKNTGNQEGPFDLRLKSYDLIDSTQREWLKPGEEKALTFGFMLPEDLEEKDYFADYELIAQSLKIKGQIKYHLAGISLNVNASLDKPYYSEGETAHLTINIQSLNPNPQNLFARVNYAGYEPQQTFTLIGSQVLIFDVPLTQITGEKLFYGIYHESGRSIYLNSLYIHKAGDVITITTDKQVYNPGETVFVTVTGSASGDLILSGPGGFNETFVFIGSVTSSFGLPSLIAAGTYFINLQLITPNSELITQNYPFDIAGIQVKVLECQNDKGKYASSDTITTTFTILSNTTMPAVLKAWVVDPSGQYTSVGEQSISLSSLENSLITYNSPLITSVSGIHRLVYGIYGSGDMLLCSGSEAFDVGDAVLMGLSTDKKDYATNTELVTVIASLYGSVIVDLQLDLDGTVIKNESIPLSGFYSYQTQLQNIVPGPHTLKATLTAGGLKSIKETTFTYALDSMPKPQISASPAYLDFDSISLGSTSTQTITLSSTGNVDLVIGTITLLGTNQGEFSIQNDNCSGRTISPSGNCTLDILFSPTSLGAKSASLSTPSNATDTPSLYLSLAGTGATTLNLSINPTGSGSVTGTGIDCPGDCTENFSTSGASIQLTATPSEGYQFVNWTGDINTSDNPVTLNMDTNKNVTANFTLSAYTINITSGLGGIINPSGSVTINPGGSLTITITPDAGYHVLDVLVDGVSVGPVTTYTLSNITSSHTIDVSFAINQYALTATAGPNGIISPSGSITVNYRGNQTFTITPNLGCHIVDVKVDGASVGAVPTYTFSNITSNHTIDASFAISQYTLTATAGSNGTITPSGAVTVSYGGSQTFSITPNTGYRILDVEVDGGSLGVATSYTFTNVTSDHTLNAAFKGIQVVSLPFSDNFDNYTVGVEPNLPWDNLNGGPVMVTNTESHSPPNSISVSGGPMSSESAFVNLGGTYTDTVGYEIWVKVNSASSSAFIGFFEPVLNIVPQFNTVYFNGDDGRVYFYSDDSNHGFMVPLLNNFALGVWHKVHVEIDFVNLVADVFIDDILVGSGLPVSPKDGTWAYQGTHSFQLNKIGVIHHLGSPFYFDDFSVFEWNLYTPVGLLRSAGPGQWAVLGMGGIGSASNTNISMSGSSSVKGTVAHMGVANAGNVSMSGSSLINGTLFLNTAGRLSRSGTSRVAGGVVQNTATDGVLDQAVADALAASQSAAALPATITSITSINITNPSQNITITGSIDTNVLHLTKLNITSGTLTLSAPSGGSFIINISGNFNLSGGSRIVLGGGITPSDVLYNIVGSGGNVSMSGGSAVSGILLAPERGISNSTGIVTGEVIGGGSQISSSGTGQVNNPGP